MIMVDGIISIMCSARTEFSVTIQFNFKIFYLMMKFRTIVLLRAEIKKMEKTSGDVRNIEKDHEYVPPGSKIFEMNTSVPVVT